MHALAIQGLNKTYANGLQAVKNIDLVVEQGDFFALLGPNGAGKSTTIGIICSLVNKSSGVIKVFGHDLDSDPDKVKSMIGIVPQEFNFNQFENPRQVLVNQAGYYGIKRKEALQRAEKYLKMLDLWEKHKDPSRELSGGMKRRLMIGRALMHNPKLLILDEPTAGVDIELRRSMWEFLQKINAEGVTIILTTHYLEEAEMLCRNVAIIDQGRIIEHSPIQQLLNQLNSEIFILDIQPTTKPFTLKGFTYQQIDEQRLEIEVPKEVPINAVFAQLTEQNVQVLSLRNKANRLEELFVRLTRAAK